MKNYTYNGQLGSVSIRTTAGVLTLQRGVTASAAKELHQAAKKHPVVQALIKTGELTVTGEFAPAATVNPLQDHAETDAVKAAAKAADDAERAKAETDKAAAADPNPAIHQMHGAIIVDDPVTTQLASAPVAPESGDTPTAAADTSSQPVADQASTTTTDAPPPAADNSAENVTNVEPVPKPPTIPQLKKQLDEAGIKYEANAKRDELVALLPKQG